MACDHGSPKFFYSTMSDTGLRGGSQNQMSARDVLPDTVIQFQSVVTNSFFSRFAVLGLLVIIASWCSASLYVAIAMVSSLTMSWKWDIDTSGIL